ncbi:hypothetical protein BX592_101360 [Paraburkholderia rhizosphaerae]|uniref:Uncharacterized protein n=1 Tax=Paraburkholderia rhizosphaerae TaxID=480658 RepID=A0A4R8M210_9BURK|nr:hypothetical protein BX592_101360 [Paraburkholderia rhizosphaerae]
MNNSFSAVLAVATCVALSIAPVDYASAQTGGGVTRHMQNAQRSAHEKARAARGASGAASGAASGTANGAAQNQTKLQKEMSPPAPASDAH